MLNYFADLTKKLEMCLTAVSVLLKITFGHTQISLPKIGIPMLKTACISPCPFPAPLFLMDNMKMERISTKIK